MGSHIPASRQAEQIIDPVFDRLNSSEQKQFCAYLDEIGKYEERSKKVFEMAKEDDIDELYIAADAYDDKAVNILKDVQALADTVSEENIAAQAADYRRELSLAY